MDTHLGAATNAPDVPAVEPSGAEQCEPAIRGAAELHCTYVVSEDLDHLWRTGSARPVLLLRWTR